MWCKVNTHKVSKWNNNIDCKKNLTQSLHIETEKKNWKHEREKLYISTTCYVIRIAGTENWLRLCGAISCRQTASFTAIFMYLVFTFNSQFSMVTGLAFTLLRSFSLKTSTQSETKTSIPIDFINKSVYYILFDKSTQHGAFIKSK